MDNEMEQRRRRLESTCAALPRFGLRYVLSAAVDSAKLFVMPYRQLVWCPVYKAASTNWMLNIPLLSNFRCAVDQTTYVEMLVPKGILFV